MNMQRQSSHLRDKPRDRKPTYEYMEINRKTPIDDHMYIQYPKLGEAKLRRSSLAISFCEESTALVARVWRRFSTASYCSLGFGALRPPSIKARHFPFPCELLLHSICRNGRQLAGVHLASMQTRSSDRSSVRSAAHWQPLFQKSLCSPSRGRSPIPLVLTDKYGILRGRRRANGSFRQDESICHRCTKKNSMHLHACRSCFGHSAAQQRCQGAGGPLGTDRACSASDSTLRRR